jgi:hypothetical protein
MDKMKDKWPFQAKKMKKGSFIAEQNEYCYMYRHGYEEDQQ